MRSLLLSLYFLSADQADYNGQDLIFSGHFQVEHPLGDLKAEKATLKDLQLNRSTKKGAELFLEQGVSLAVTQGKTPFAIRSERSLCSLPPTSLFSLFQSEEFQFYENVKISTFLNIRAEGGSAFYKMGVLTLYPSEPSSDCQLYRDTDKIDAAVIQFNLLKEELICSHPKGTLRSRATKTPLAFSSDTLLWQKKTGELHLEKEVFIEQPGQFCLYADHALLSCQKELEPHSFMLEGNVHLFSLRVQDKESNSIADKILFNIAEQTLILSATPPKRVLFWQEGLALSAPEVHIRRDLLTSQDTVEGKGEVHFTFDMEEANIIEQALSKFL